jgi:hypothetical protein
MALCIRRNPDQRTLDVEAYRQLLDETIVRIPAREKQADSP